MRIATCAAMGLSTLAALPAGAQTSAQPYRAVGAEPFWLLTIDRRRIRYEPAEGRAVTVNKPRPTRIANGERYAKRGLVVEIANVRCTDGMRDHSHPHTVTVTVEGRSLKGCGGRIQRGRPGQEISSVEGEWMIRSIGGRLVVPDTNPNIAFRRSVLSGTTGCNSFRGSYRVEGGAMIAGPLATTRRACRPPVNQQEQRLLALLGKRLTTSRNGERLVLTAPNGQTLVLTPVLRR